MTNSGFKVAELIQSITSYIIYMIQLYIIGYISQAKAFIKGY